MFVRSYTVSVDGGRDDRKIKSFDVSSPLKIRIRICEHSLFLSDCFEINDHCSKWSLWLLVDCTNVIKMAGSLFIRLTAAVLEQFFSRCARLIMLLQVHASWLNFQIRCTKKFMFFESPSEHQKKTWTCDLTSFDAGAANGRRCASSYVASFRPTGLCASLRNYGFLFARNYNDRAHL